MRTAVPNTDHDARYIFYRRVTKHGNLIVRMSIRVVIDFIRDIIPYTDRAGTFGFVTRHFRIRQGREWEVEHILFRPYCPAVAVAVVVIQSLRGQGQGNLIFVVVILQVATQTNETGQFIVSQIRVDTRGLGVHEHLQFLVVTQVVRSVLIHGFGIVRGEVLNFQHHRLLVLRYQLRLSGIGLTAYARRQHIVDRCLGTVLLNTYRLHIQAGFRRGIGTRTQRTAVIETLRVLSPVAANEVEVRKTQVSLMVKARHVNTHEADRLEVTNRTHRLHCCAVAVQGYLKLIPPNRSRLAVAQRHHRLQGIGYMLLTLLHHVGTQFNMVRVVFLVLVEGVIVIDILYIRCER